MTKRLISFLIAVCLLIAIPLSARYKYNPFTRKLDYYEPVSGSDLGDLGDVTLTGLATGNILYYNGTAWVNLATGANTNVLTLAGGVPTWAATGAPAAHAASHEVGGADLVDHDQLTNYLAAQHLTLPAGIAAVLTDHDLAAHTVLGLFDASGDVDHNATTNWVANKHINWTAAADNFSTSEDFFLAWTEAADHASITQTAVAGIATVPLIDIDDDRTGVTADTVGEATIVMNAAGTYAFYVQTGAVQFDASFEVLNVLSYDYTTDHNLLLGYLAGQDLTSGQGQYNTLFGEQAGTDITTGDDNVIVGYQAAFSLKTGGENVIIGRDAAYLIETGSYNVYIGKEVAYERVDGQENVVIGWQAAYGAVGATYDRSTIVGTWAGYALDTGNENNLFGAYAAGELTDGNDNCAFGAEAMYNNQTGNYNVVIGNQAGMGVSNNSYSTNVIIGTQAAKTITTGGNNVILGYQAAEDFTSGTGNVVIGYMAGEGWLDAENDLLVIDNSDTATPLIYGDFSADNITINGDWNVTMDAALDQIVIAQSAVAGTATQPLILIDDDRTGVTADTKEEATIRIDAEGTHSMYIEDGYVHISLNSGLEIGGHAWMYDTKEMRFGTGGNGNFAMHWNTSSTGDDNMILKFPIPAATDSTVLFIYSAAPNPVGLTSHENYISPTFVLANSNGADLNDYAGVVIGERTQADVEIAHYFDFFAMTGAIDAAADPTTTEIPAIFRFGASGSAIPDNATTPGDVLIEGNFEADGTIYADGGIVHVVSKEVNFDDGSPVAIATVADGYMVTCVIVEITTTWDGNGTIVVGDGNDPDGYMEDGDITQGAAAYYGWHHDERGVYLWDSAGAGTGHDDCLIYTGADTVDATLVAGTSNQGVATVYVHLIRLK